MISLFLGMPGCGKSLLMHDLIRAQPAHRYFVVEHSNEWAKGAAHWRGRAPRIVDVWNTAQLEKMVSEHGELPPGVYRCVGMGGWEVCKLAIANGPAVYVDDEIDVAARQTKWMLDGNPLPDLVHRGRHLPNARGEICEVHCMGAGRRPQNIATDLTDLCDETYVFRCQGNRTRQRLEADSTIDTGDWEKVRNLPRFHFRHSPSGKWMSIPPL